MSASRRLIRICAFLILPLLFTGIPTSISGQSLAIVEDDNYGQYYIWVWTLPQCPQLSPLPYGAGLIEDVVKNTLPMEWGPSWVEHALKAGAVMVRTVAWQHWFGPQGPGEFNFYAGNLDKGQEGAYPDCERNQRMNYYPEGSTKYGSQGSYGSNNATTNTKGLYIPSGDGIRYINWGSFEQNRTNCWAGTYGGNFYDAIVFAYHQGATGYCDSATSDYTYRPAPLALESGDDPKPFHQPVLDAYMRNTGGAAVGWTYNNGGGEWVHRWGSGYVQDVKGGSGGKGALMQSDSNNSMAYWIHGDIWDWYVKERGAEGWLGYPTSDENSVQQWCASPKLRSNLQGGYITYDCNKSRWRSFTNNDRVPLHRYYIPGTGKHFYADNYYEGDSQNGSQEGIMGYMRPNLVGGTKALYRWFAPSNNDHLYTDNPYEQPGGYYYEGIEGYVYQSGGGGYYPIHRLYNPSNGEHFLTNSDSEKNYLVSIGWSYEGVRGYLSSAP